MSLTFHARMWIFFKDPQIGIYTCVRSERRTVRSAGQPGWRATGGGAPQGPPPCSARPGRGPAAPPPAPSPRSACACCRRCRRPRRGPGTLGCPTGRSSASLQRGSAHCAPLAPVRESSIISITVKTQYENSQQIFSGKEQLRGYSAQFLDSCFCEPYIYSSDRSACSAAGEYIDRSQTH